MPGDLHDSSVYWQRMFQTYSSMVNFEANEFGYHNGIYAGDLFVTKDGRHKQRDWNIRRGGRSSPESMIIFGMPSYETKVTLAMSDFGLNKQLSNVELFHLYMRVCRQLLDDYGIYSFSSGFGYCGQDNPKEDYLKFNFLVHPKWLVEVHKNGEKLSLPRCEYRKKMEQIVRDMMIKSLRHKK